MRDDPLLRSTNSNGKSGARLSRKQVVRLVHRCVADPTPIAVVRFGEGEARLLAADADDSISVRVAIKKLRRQTGLTFSQEEMFKVKANVMSALDQADVVGLHTGPGFSEEHKELGERIEAIYAERIARGRKPGYTAHSLVNNDLRDALPSLLQSQNRLSIVSCRDIGETLKADHELSHVSVYQVPSQYVVRDVDGTYEEALHDVAIWPDFYRALYGRIQVCARGEIFLIGAGLFGKKLCIRVRELGGIALDMGSTLDGVARKVTRGRGRPAFRSFPEVPKSV